MRKLFAIAAAAFAASLYAQAGSGVALGPLEGNAALLSLGKAARVSVVAKSPTGVPISLHDKMEGEIARSGSLGSKDGRIDISLDPGEYRVRVEGMDAEGARPSLEARAFAEVNGAKESAWPLLIPGKAVGGSLADLQSASYWIYLREDGAVEVEALGRDLAVLELWREGQYLLGSYPVREIRQVEEGRPMGYACASVPAKAGLYLARLYGGERRPWEKDDGRSPLYVRSGFADMPVGGRLDLSVSPFGRDFIMVEDVDTSWLSRESEGLASLASLSYSPGGDRLASSSNSGIRKDSIDLRCSVRVPTGKALLRVEAAPGDKLRLDAFRGLEPASAAGFVPKAGGLLTVIGARSNAPELPLSGLVYRVDSRGDASVAIDFAIPLTRSDPFRARCNLGDSGARQVLLRVDEEGSYQIAEKEGKTQGAALYTLRSLDSSLRSYASGTKAAPAWAETYELRQGYYVLTVSARSLGVLDFAVQKKGLGKSSSALGKEPPKNRQSMSWAIAPDSSGRSYYVTAGPGPSRAFGYSFTPYPIALDGGLSLDLGPRESLEFPSSISSRSVLAWASGQGSLTLGGQAPLDGGTIIPGNRTLSLRNSSAADLGAAFSMTRSFDDLPAPVSTAFGSGTTALSPGKLDWRDFGRSDTALYSFTVKESGVYVIETLGRLSTSLSIRSASRLGLFSARANGYGKNAAIRAWLRPGRYYLAASTLDRSTGRGAVRMDNVPLAATASLEGGAIDRRAVPADEAAIFSFSLSKEEEIELRSIALTGGFQVRLEDEAGFPAYRGDGRTRLRLSAGRYLLYSLPVSIDTNRLTWVRSLEPPAIAAPVPGTRGLVLNFPASADWSEKAEPDRWSFSVPSPLLARLDLPAAFDAVLEGPGEKRGLGPDERGEIKLGRGAYTLSVRPRDKANQLRYSIGVYTSVLAPGVSGIAVSGSRPSSTGVSVPEDGFYELWSLGRSDVSARLYRMDEAGATLVDRSDDNGPDWNFDIVRRLKAGVYRLDVGSLAGSSEPVELRLTSRNAKSAVVAAAPYEGALRMDAEGVILPFDAKAGEGLYLIRAAADPQSGAPVSLRIYRGDDFIAAGEGQVAVPLRANARYSVYAWTPIPSRPTLSVKRLPEKQASISAPLSLKAGEAARMLNPDALSAVVASGALLVSPGLEIPCADPGAAPFSTYEAGGWAWAPDADSSTRSLALGEDNGAVLALSDLGQGFSVSSRDAAILVSVDTRGQFRCGVSAKESAAKGAPLFDWDASASWSQGSVALLPPGDWKARIWDGERGAAASGESPTRRAGAGVGYYAMASLPALKVGDKRTISVAPGQAIAMDAPACALSLLMGRDLVLSAWKGGEAYATAASLDERKADTIALGACVLIVANTGSAESSLRLSVMPPGPAGSGELSASRSFEAVGIPPEGVALVVKASEGDLLCLAGDECEAELEAADGSYAKLIHDPASGLYSSMAAASGRLRLRSASGGLARAYLAKKGKEVEGLIEQGKSATRALDGAATLTGKGDAFDLTMKAPGYVDLSCPGPGVLSLSGGSIERRVALSGSREDMHLFAWLPAGKYSVWQRPARGAAAGGYIRADRVESRPAADAVGTSAFIGVREYQAWSFEAAAPGRVGVGVKAETDGLTGFLYDSRQGLVAEGPLCFPVLEAGSYLFVVKGLDSAPIEYELALEGLDGSRVGVPREVVDRYKSEGGASASISVPMTRRSASSQGGRDRYVEDDYYGEDEYYEDGEYYEDEYYEGDYESEDYDNGR